jgi:predicted metalloendopeptidase
LGENIADSGGISIALMAYRDYINNNGQQPEPLLPGFETFTQEQMLFISYGISRCQYIPPDLSGLKVSESYFAPNDSSSNNFFF